MRCKLKIKIKIYLAKFDLAGGLYILFLLANPFAHKYCAEVHADFKQELSMPALIYCYKLVQGFRVTCLFTGQYNTKGYVAITDVI